MLHVCTHLYVCITYHPTAGAEQISIDAEKHLSSTIVDELGRLRLRALELVGGLVQMPELFCAPYYHTLLPHRCVGTAETKN